MIASHIMSTTIKTLAHDATVSDALTLLENSHFSDIPVVDNQGEPVGIVTARSILHHALPDYASDNLLAAMGAGPDIKSVYDNIEHILDDGIHNVSDTNFMTIKPSTPTSAIAAMLVNLKGDTHNILVLDHKKLVGIISARDILNRFTMSA